MNERDHLEALGTDGRIILEWILGKKGGKLWTGCIWLKMGISGGSNEENNEPLDSIKGREFLD